MPSHLQGRAEKGQRTEKKYPRVINQKQTNQPPHKQNKTKKTTAIKPHHLLSGMFRTALQVLQPSGSQPSFPMSTRQYLKGRGNEAHTPFDEKGRLNWPYSESSLRKISNSCLRTTGLQKTQLRIMVVCFMVKILHFIPNCRIVVLEKNSIFSRWYSHPESNFLLTSLGKKLYLKKIISCMWNTVTSACLCLTCGFVLGNGNVTTNLLFFEQVIILTQP